MDLFLVLAINGIQVDRIGGGTIGCDPASLARWHTAYYALVERFRGEGRFLGKDQNIMATTCLETDLCLLLPGDLVSSPNTGYTPQFCVQGHWFRMQDWLRGDWSAQYTRLNLSSPAAPS